MAERELVVGLMASHLNKLFVHFFVPKQVLFALWSGTSSKWIILLKAVLLIEELEFVSHRCVEAVGSIAKLLLAVVGKEFLLT